MANKLNTYLVRDQDIEELKRDKRVFAPVVLAGRMMLAAKGDPELATQQFREIVDVVKESGLSDDQRGSIISFAWHIFRLQEMDIEPWMKGDYMIAYTTVDEEFLKARIKARKKEFFEENPLGQDMKPSLKYFLEEFLTMGIEEGIKVGIKVGEKMVNEKTARKMLSSGKFAVEEICDLLAVDERTVLKLKAGLEVASPAKAGGSRGSGHEQEK